jgi:hypothetical protein
LQLDLSTSQGAACLLLGASLNGCWAGSTLIASALLAIDAPFPPPALRDAFADGAAALINSSALFTSSTAQALPALLSQINSVHGFLFNLTASSLGNSTNETAVQSALDAARDEAEALQQAAEDPDSPLNTAGDCIQALAGGALEALSGAAAALVLALDVLYNSATCEFLVPLWEAVLLRISGENGPAFKGVWGGGGKGPGARFGCALQLGGV